MRNALTRVYKKFIVAVEHPKIRPLLSSTLWRNSALVGTEIVFSATRSFRKNEAKRSRGSGRQEKKKEREKTPTRKLNGVKETRCVIKQNVSLGAGEKANEKETGDDEGTGEREREDHEDYSVAERRRRLPLDYNCTLLGCLVGAVEQSADRALR